MTRAYVVVLFLYAACIEPRKESPVLTAREESTCPRPPKIEWLPPGCPPQFAACLSGADAATLKVWMARCGHGR